MSTTTAVVPAAVQIAAKRAFIRTLAQGYAGAIPAGGVTAAALVNLTAHPHWAAIGAAAAAWVLAPVVAAFTSWLSILSKGVPAAYTGVVQIAASDPTLVPAGGVAGATLVPDPTYVPPVITPVVTPAPVVDSPVLGTPVA